MINFLLIFSLAFAQSQAHISELLQEINFPTFPLANFQDDQVVAWNFGTVLKPVNGSLNFDLRFYAPTKPGTYPVIVFLTGLDGLAMTFLYSDFLIKLVKESNSIVIGFDILKPPKLPEKEAYIFGKSLNWTLENINELFENKKTPEIIKNKVFPDINSNGVTLMSHSASGHTAVSYLVDSCGLIKRNILLDPVDGYDPFGFIKIFVTNPPKQLPFTIPTLLIRTGLDPVPVHSGIPACAPSNFSNNRFYKSLPGPTWMLNFTDYGHADILDDYARKYMTYLICTPCKTNCKFDLYRTNVVKAISFFLQGVNEKNETFIEALENPAESNMFDKDINITAEFKYNGFDILNTGPFCNNSQNRIRFFQILLDKIKF